MATRLQPPFPLGAFRVTSPFGVRVHPVTKQVGSFHNGVDFGCPTGTPLRALSDGRVTFAGELASSPGSGIALGVACDDGITSWSFSHCSQVLVSVGARVTQGQVVALSGNTGQSTGPHLHLVVRKRGDAVDPLPLLKRRGGGGLVFGGGLAALGWWVFA